MYYHSCATLHQQRSNTSISSSIKRKPRSRPVYWDCCANDIHYYYAENLPFTLNRWSVLTQCTPRQVMHVVQHTCQPPHEPIHTQTNYRNITIVELSSSSTGALSFALSLSVAPQRQCVVVFPVCSARSTLHPVVPVALVHTTVTLSCCS